MNTEAAKQVIDLTETMHEALELARRHSGQKASEEALGVLTDTMEAFSAVERTLLEFSILPSGGDTGRENLQQHTDELRDGFDWMVQSLENVSDASPYEVINFTLMPRFQAWQAALRSCLRPFIVS